MRRSAALLAAALLAAAAPARADHDPPVLGDPRALALGGTGVAHAEGAAAVAQNPAALEGVARFSAAVGLAPILVRASAPLPGAGPSAVAGEARVAPFFFGGAALRLHDRVVFGLAAYPTTSFPVRLGGAGRTLEATTSAIEISPAVSLALVKGLSLGLGYRVTAAARLLDDGARQVTLRGWGFTAMDAGIAFRPFERLSLGLAFRSKATASLRGTVASSGASLDARSTFTSPPALRFGVAAALLPERLLVTAEIAGFFHAATPAVSTTLLPGTAQEKTVTTPLDLRDAVAVGLGVEGRPLPDLALRAGYREASSPTSPGRPAWWAPPPAAERTLTWGLGVRRGAFDVDVAGAYSFARAEVKATQNGEPAGEYALGALTIAASVTWRR